MKNSQHLQKSLLTRLFKLIKVSRLSKKNSIYFFQILSVDVYLIILIQEDQIMLKIGVKKMRFLWRIEIHSLANT